MLDFNKYTFQRLMNSILSNITNAIDKREGSITQAIIAPIVQKLSEFYYELNSVQNNAYIETARGEALDMIVVERGLARRPAIQAVKKGLFNIEIDIGTSFTTIAGKSSLTYEAIEFIGKNGEYYEYKLRCTEAGTAGNSYTGNLQVNSPINGLTFAQMTDILVDGTETEDDASLRQRYMDSLLEKPFGGNIASYKENLMAIAGVGAVQVYPFWRGGGTVMCCIISTEFNLASAELIAECQKQICPPEAEDDEPSKNGYGLAPIGAIATIKTADRFNINITGVLTLGVGMNAEAVNEEILAGLEDYMLTIRKKWGSRVSTNSIMYNVTIIHAQVLAVIINTNGVMDCQNLLINGGESNIICKENNDTQELPFVGDVKFTIAGVN